MTARTSSSNEPRHVRGSVFSALAQRSDFAPFSKPVWSVREIALGLLVAGAYLTASVVSIDGNPHGDETYHFAQITQYLAGQWHGPDTHLSTIPGYHAALAALLWLSGQDSIGAARVINALLGLLAIAAFFVLRRGLWPGSERVATAQWVVLPILAPLFFLVYTDVLALALVLWAFVAAFSGRHRLAAVILAFDMLVRQNDVVWVGLLAALCAWPLLRESNFDRDVLRDCARRTWPFALPLAVFLTYWIWHGSLTWSRAEAPLHPELGLHVGSPAFALLVAGALLPAHLMVGCVDFVRSLRRRPWLVAVPLALFAIFFFGFRADNPYNTVLTPMYPRNLLLHLFADDMRWRAISGVACAVVAVSLATTRLRPAGAAWLYPFAAFFLASSWLIDQRYMLCPFTLWLAFREPRSATIEYATFALWLGVAVFVDAGIVGNRFLL